MKKLTLSIFLFLQLGISGILNASPKVEVSTNMGAFIIELDDDKAPKSTDNFLSYVDSGFYDGTIFHRVIPGILIQGGGYSSDLGLKPTKPPVISEAQNGLSNQAYTIAMARYSNPDSATSQFFINIKNNDRLDFPKLGGNGYTVFGKVISGMDVIDAINREPTSSAVAKTGGNMMDVPITPVIINSIKKTNNVDAKNISASSSTSKSGISKENVSTDTIQDAKKKCLDLGFKDKTEEFGKCVLRLSK